MRSPIFMLPEHFALRRVGCEEKEILIELDRDRVSAAGLNIYEMAQELGSDNFTLASGTVREGPRKLMLRKAVTYLPDEVKGEHL